MILQVGVKIFLRDPEGKYLLMRRSPEKYPGVKGEWYVKEIIDKGYLAQ